MSTLNYGAIQALAEVYSDHGITDHTEQVLDVLADLADYLVWNLDNGRRDDASIEHVLGLLRERLLRTRREVT